MSMDSDINESSTILSPLVLDNTSALYDKDDFVTTEKHQRHYLLVISILASFVLHICFVYFFYDINPYKNLFTNTSNKINVRKFLTVKLENKAERTKPDNEKSEPVSSPVQKQVIVSKETKQKDKVPIVKSQRKKFNALKIASSVQSYIEQDRQDYDDKLFIECQQIITKTGELDCISNSERLGYQNQDVYKLAQFFKRLDKNPNSKNKQRILKTLVLQEKKISQLLQQGELPDDLKLFFNDEIAYLRSETHYQDCDGSPSSGNCAGEIDLLKVAKLISLLITTSDK